MKWFASWFRRKPAPVKPPVVTPVPTPVTTSSTMPTGTITSGGRTWTPVFADDYLNTSDKNYALYTDGSKDTSGLGVYESSNVTVHDSLLDLHVHSINGQPSGAVVMPDSYAAHNPGTRISIRYKADSVKGYKFVGLLWPCDNSWTSEIDWPEGDLDGQVRPKTKHNGTATDFLPVADLFAGTTTDFHVATTEWNEDSVSFYWDDELITTVTNTAYVPAIPMRIALQAETWIGEGAVPASSDGHVLIDWIVVYN